MAASSAMQSILASPLIRVVSNRSTRVNQFLIIPTSSVPHLPRYASIQLRCMVKVMKSMHHDIFIFIFVENSKFDGNNLTFILLWYVEWFLSKVHDSTIFCLCTLQEEQPEFVTTSPPQPKPKVATLNPGDTSSLFFSLINVKYTITIFLEHPFFYQLV